MLEGHLVLLLLVSGALPLAFARHQILASGEPSLVDQHLTVNSGYASGGVSVFEPDETAWIYATLRSPTTHLISFSPDRLPLSRSKMTRTSSLGTFNRTIQKLVVQQRACKLKTGATYASCYRQEFDSSSPDSEDRGFQFFRAGGTGGRSDADVAVMRGVEQETGTSVRDQFAALGFMGLNTAEYGCNNHRAVSVDIASPNIPAQFPGIDWDDVFYNDAELGTASDALQTYYGTNGNPAVNPGPPAGRRLEVRDGMVEERRLQAGNPWETGINMLPPNNIDWHAACTWKPENTEYMQEVQPISGNGGYQDRRTYVDPSTGQEVTMYLPYGEQPHPDQLGISVGNWDHNLEVCAYVGDGDHECDPKSAQCINAYTLQMQDEENGNVYFVRPTQIPADGAGDLLMLRASPANGPYAPCPIDADGVQVPCMNADETHKGVKPSGFAPADPMHFFVDELAIDNLVHMGENSFTMRISYDIMWSDRFAVHPW